MKLFSFPKTPKICDLQPCTNKRTFRMKKTLEYKDDKIPCALRNKMVPRFLRLALGNKWIWPLENLSKFFLK